MNQLLLFVFHKCWSGIPRIMTLHKLHLKIACTVHCSEWVGHRTQNSCDKWCVNWSVFKLENDIYYSIYALRVWLGVTCFSFRKMSYPGKPKRLFRYDTCFSFTAHATVKKIPEIRTLVIWRRLAFTKDWGDEEFRGHTLNYNDLHRVCPCILYCSQPHY